MADFLQPGVQQQAGGGPDAGAEIRMAVEIVGVQANDPRAPAATVELSLEWTNGWRDERNHDAVWFVVREPGGELLRLADGKAVMSTVPVAVRTSEDGVGAFVVPEEGHAGEGGQRPARPEGREPDETGQAPLGDPDQGGAGRPCLAARDPRRFVHGILLA